MADEYFKFEWDGLDEITSIYKNAHVRMNRIIKEELSKYGLRVEEVSKSLAPIDSGELENSINAGKVIYNGPEFVITVGTNLEYALRRHEERESSITRPKYFRGVKYDNYYQNGRGQKTREKPSVKGYKPGRKYLTNAIKVTESDWNEMCQRIITRFVEEV